MLISSTLELKFQNIGSIATINGSNLPSEDQANYSATTIESVAQIPGVKLYVSIKKSEQTLAEEFYRHDGLPKENASRALEVIKKELIGVNKIVSVLRPSISKSPWDFALKDGRMLVMDSNLNSSDKKWLESVLNANSTLASAVAKVTKAAVDDWETNEENPTACTWVDGKNAGSKSYYDVTNQLNGKIRIKDLLEESVKMLGQVSCPTIPQCH